MPQFLQPTRRLFFPVVLLVLSFLSFNVAAAVIITKGTGGNLCVGSGYSPLTNIVLTEGANADFTGSGTIILNTSANFEFNTAVLPGVAVTGTGISTTGASFSSATSLTINITLFGGNGGVINTITISGLQIRAVTAATLGGKITRAGTVTLNGVTAGSTSFADLNSYASPTVADAGPPQSHCNLATFTLAGNTPGTGTGAWTLISGPAGITTPASPTSGVTGVTAGNSATLRWTISNGACTPSIDDVVLTNYATATVSAAGPDINQCNNGNFTMAANVPVTGSGLWTVTAGTAIIVSPTANNSAVVGVPVGTNATLRWTITNGSCSNFNDVILFNNASPAPAVSGLNSVCAGASGLHYTTTSIVGHTYSWSITGGSITLGGLTNDATVSWGAAGAGTLTVTETITATGCNITTSNYNVTINANPTPSITTGTPTVCAGVTGVAYSTANVGGHTYNWTISGGTITAGAGTNAVTVSWGGAGSGTLTVNETITATGCSATSPVYNVTINANPTPVVSGLNSVCAGASGLHYTTTSIVGHTYSWSITGGSITLGGLTNDATVSWGAAGAGTLTVTETITATGCNVTTSNYNVTINANPTPSITTGTPTVCAGATGVAYSTANVGGHTYNWTISGGTITAGAGTNAVTVSWGGAGSGTLTVNETITATGCSATSAVYNVTINANPTPVVSGLNSICAGVTGLHYTTTNIVGHTYSWSITGGSITLGGLTNDATVSWGAAGAGTLTVTETITATGCNVTTGNYNVTINANPTPSITTGTPTVCAGATGVAYSTANVGGHTYNWTISGGTITAGAGTNAVTVSWGGAGSGTLTVNETITATGCSATSAVYNVTINANPTPVVSGLNSICAGVTGLHYTTTNIVGHTYSWSITGGSITLGGLTNDATVTWGAAGAGTLTVTETITATGCNVTTGNYNVTINANPTPSITTGTPTVCAGATGVAYSTANVGGHTYNWTISGGTITAGAGTNAVTVSWGGAGSGTLTVNETITATGCSATSPVYNVTINANPTPVVSGLNSICAGVTGLHYTTTNIVGHTYSWSITGGSITLGGLTNDATVSWGAAGAGTLTVTETITATGCNVTTGNYNVTINANPTPSITTGTPTVCAGATGVAYSTANVGGHTYNWTISGGTITAGAGTNAVTVSWGGAGSGTLTVNETITATGCSATSAVYNVTINANPTPVVSGLNSICAGVTGLHYTTTNIVGHTYSWSITGGSITLGGLTNDATVSWGAAGAGTLTVTETITATGCNVTTGNYNVTINANPTPSITTGTPTVCAGATGVAYSTANVGGHTYNWTISGGTITAGAGTNAVTVSWGGAGSGTLTVNETITATGCSATSAVYNVTINANPTPVVSGLNSICAGVTGLHYTTTNIVGHTYSWSITGGSITLGGLTNDATVSWGAAGAGTLTVTETITATGCNVTTGNYNVTINANPTPSITTGTPTVCAGVTGVAYSTANVGGHTYNWTISGGTITAGAGTNAVTVSWGGAGSGMLTVNETITATGCSATSPVYNVTINPIPTFSITDNTGGGTKSICSGSQVDITLTSPTPGAVLTLQNVIYGSITGGLYAAGGTFATGGHITESAGGLVNPTTAPLTVTYVFSAAAAGCNNPTTQQTVITVNPTPAMTINNTTAGICSGSSVNITLNSVTSGAVITLNTVTYGAVSGTITAPKTYTPGSVITESLVNATSAPIIVTYSFSVSANGCTTAGPFTTTVTVNPLPTTGAVPLNTTLCGGLQTNIVLSNTNAVPGGVTYNWTVSVLSGTVLGQSNGPGSSPIIQTLTTDNVGGIVRYAIRATSVTGSCVGPVVNADVTVNPVPTASVSGASTATQCSGSTTNIVLQNPNSVLGTSYTWTTSLQSGTVGGHSAGSGGVISQTLTTNSGGGVVRYIITPIANGCSGTAINWDVTVNPVPASSNIVEPVICSNQAFSYDPQLEITNGVVSTFSWTAVYDAGLTGGLANSSGPVAGTLVNVTGGVLKAVYTVIPTAPGPGSCVGNPFTITVQVNPKPVGTTMTLASVCSDSPFSYNAQGEISNGVASTFTWTAVYDAGLVGGAASGGGPLTGTLTNTSGSPLNAVFTVTPTSTSGCLGSNFTLTVPILTEPKGTDATATAICSDASAGYNLQGNVTTTNGVISNFSWKATSNAGVTGESITSQSGPVINDILVNVSGTLQNVIYTVTPTSVAGCLGNTFTITVPVNSKPVGTNLTEPAVCSGSAFSYDPQPQVSMTSTFTWTAAYATGISGGSGSGAGLLAETLFNFTNGTLNAVYTITSTSGGCVGSPFTITVPVKPTPTFSITDNTGGGTKSICSGSQVDITLTSPTPGAVLTLQNVIYGSITGGLYAAGGTFATGGHITESAGGLVNPTTAPLTVTYVFSAAAAGCNNPTTQQTVITVNPTPAMTINNTTAGICSGNSVNITLNSVTSGAVITLNTVTYGAVSGTITAPKTYTPGSVITESLVNATSAPIIVTYSFSVSANGCTTAGPFTTTVTVNPLPTTGAVPLNTTLCGGLQTNIVLSNTNAVPGGVTYNWTVSVLSGTVLGQSNGPGSSPIIQTLTTDNVGGIVRYAIRATSVTGSCVGPVVNADVTVNPVPTASVSGASTATQCSGSTTNIVLQNPNSVLGTSYTWTTSLQSGTVGGHSAGSGGVISQTLTTNSGGGVVRYIITPIANGCSGTAINWDVTVNPVPASSNIVEPVICSNQAFSYDPQLEITNGVVSTFSWTAVYDAGLTGGLANSSGPVAGTLVNVTGGVLKAVYTVIPTAPGPGSCVGNPFTITVQVNPKPVGTTMTLASVCSDSPFSYNAQGEISNGVASTFTWTAVYDAGLVGGAASGGGPLTGTLTNTSGSPLNAVFTVTPTSTSGCLGSNFTLTVPILTEPKGTDATATAICSDASAGYNLQGNVTTTNGVISNFSWKATSNAGVTGESITSQSGPVINDILVNVSGTLQNVIYTVTPTSVAGCLGNTFTITVPVNSKPVGTNLTEPAVCSGSAFSYDPQPQVSMTSTFTWTAAYATGISGGSGSGAGLLAETLFNFTNGTLNAVYTITSTSGGCVGSPFTITVPISPQPVGVGQIKTVCSDLAINITLGTAATSVPAISYNIISISSAGLTSTGGSPVTGPGQSATVLQNDVWKNITSSPIDAIYTIVPVTATCIGNPFIVNATINPEPVGVAQTVFTCSDISANYNLTSNVALLGNNIGSTFSWIALTPNPQLSGQSVTSKNGAVINDVLTNLSGVNQNQVYTVTPTGANSCGGANFLITITVYPEPVGTTTVIPTKTICSGSSVSYPLQANVNLTHVVPSSFTWSAASNPNLSGETSSIKTTSMIDDILDNIDPAFAAQTTSYTVIPTSTAHSCLGDPFVVSVTVNHQAVVSAGPDLAVCVNNTSVVLQGSITYSPGIVTWSSSSLGAFATNSGTPTYTYSAADIATPPTLTITAADPDGLGASGPCNAVSDIMILKVNPLPNVNFSGLPASGHVAQNFLPQIRLDATNSGGLFTIVPGSGLSSTTQDPGTGFDFTMLDPNSATVDTLNLITYTFTDANSCTGQKTKSIFIDEITDIDFGLNPAKAHQNPSTLEWETCGQQDTIRLIGAPGVDQGDPAGTFFETTEAYSGQVLRLGLVFINGQYYIDTDNLPSDTYAVRYVFTNGSGAVTRKVKNIKLFGSPTAAINVANSCIVSAIQFNDASTLPTAVGSLPPPSPIKQNWDWNFADLVTSQQQNPSHTYTASGLYVVSLKVTTQQGCSNSTTKQIRVGDVPVVDFKWSAICNNDSTKFQDITSTGSISVISNYQWEFGDGTIISGAPLDPVPGGPSQSGGTMPFPRHKYDLSQTYDVKLTVDTNDGCSNSAHHNVFILPFADTTVVVSSSGYRQDFEASDGNWKVEAIQNTIDSSWVWTAPSGDKITPNVPGSKAWWTGKNTNTYFDGEQSVVNGPCFDLSTLTRPMISLDYFVNTEAGHTGAVIQYSINGGQDWDVVGAPGEGIEWYPTNPLIISNPGHQQGPGPYGWSGLSGKWLRASANLDNIPKDVTSGPNQCTDCRKQVRFRVAFSADAQSVIGTAFDGFAFDNFFVGDKRRNVMIEHFTNAGQSASGFADAYLDQLQDDWIALKGTTDFRDIRYHLSSPKTDPLNQDNPGDPAARALFMTVTEPPFSIMDGRLDSKFTGFTSALTPVEIDRRALKDPKFDLDLTANIGTANNKLDVKLVITADTAFTTSRQFIAQVVLVEDVVDTYRNVVRKNLFGTAGENINKTWIGPAPPLPGEQLIVAKSDIEITVPISNSISNLSLVGYIQDKDTKEIYQSVVIRAPDVQGGTITGTTEPNKPGVVEEIQIFPNPANGNFNFTIPHAIPVEYTWKIVDQRGVEVQTGDFEGVVDHQKAVGVGNLSNGIYFVIIGAPDKPAVYRKLAVMNHH